MARSFGTFNKREHEKKRVQKRKDKEQRKEERKANGKESKSLEDMLAYVDENGNLSSTPPNESKRRVIKETDIDLTSRNKGGSEPAPLRSGVVKYFDEAKGFGFIKDKESQMEYFFHFSSADFPIAQHDLVTFDTEMGVKGMNAVSVSKFDPSKPVEAKPIDAKLMDAKPIDANLIDAKPVDATPA